MVEAVSLTLESRVRMNASALFQELEGEAILLNLDSGIYFGLNAVGTRIWKLLAEHERLVEIVEAIVAEYNVLEAQCVDDVLTLITALKDHALITAD